MAEKMSSSYPGLCISGHLSGGKGGGDVASQPSMKQESQAGGSDYSAKGTDSSGTANWKQKGKGK